MGNNSLTKLVRLFCLIELVALAPFAFPFLNLQHVAVLDGLNQLLGGAPLPPVDTLHLVLAGVAGCISIGFVIVRWFNPTPFIATVEGVIRIGVASWLFYAGMTLSAPLLLALAVLDVIGGLL
ncbi:MAG: hypothetical protein ACPG5U_10490, partial [Planktomarina sp.]